MLKYYNKRTTTVENDNIQSYDQEKIKLSSTIITNSGVGIEISTIIVVTKFWD